MDLTFQVPTQYYSLQLWTLLSPPDTSTAERSFRFCLSASFFHGANNCPLLYPRSILDTFQPGGAHLLVSYLFCLFYTVPGVLMSRRLSGLPCLPPADQVCQNSVLWPVCVRWPYTARLIASVSYTGPFATRLWPLKLSPPWCLLNTLILASSLIFHQEAVIFKIYLESDHIQCWYESPFSHLIYFKSLLSLAPTSLFSITARMILLKDK